jgi:predicted acylesterase/phospholipase RssA
MLGRLRMSLKECKAAYIMLSEQIFTPNRNEIDPRRVIDFLKANGRFDEKPLEQRIKEAIRQRSLPVDALLHEVSEDPNEPCKVFVCATRGENSAPVVIRSYEPKNYDPLLEVCKIWEAARATSAASTFFDPIQIGPHNETFVDGALQNNNPILEANKESRDLWPGGDRMIISVGTGSAAGGSVLGNLLSLAQRVAKIALDSEHTNEKFEADNEAMVDNNHFFRFNVYQGLADVELQEYKAIDRIAAHTNTYLTKPKIAKQMNTCVETLRSGGQRLGTLEG